MLAVSLPVTSTNTERQHKLHATLVARAALAGVQLTQCTDGSWCASSSRWGLGWARTLPDEAAVEAFLRLVGAPA